MPIDALLPELAAALDRGSPVVLEAPPGAGKTTRVPPALLGADWLGDRRIVMLEPRRVAARAAARRMAHELGEPVGRTVGYRVRGDTMVGPATRIEVVTEGVLTRMLQEDPALEGVGAVIFDEFHERSINADLGLALVAGGTLLLRNDLRLVVMSATLDGDAVAALIPGSVRLVSEGRSWPVETRFAPPRPGTPLEEHVTAVVREALAREDGSVLVFLPGAGEINRIAARLEDTVPPDVDIHPLHGMIPSDRQDSAIAPAPAGRRKVVLATNIAETSLTIDGIGVVVDSGLARVPAFNPRTGMTRLETVRIPRSSADQRRGRAGRTGPGVCIRCWSAVEDAALAEGMRAEILDADLAPLVLELAAAGWHDPGELPWLDRPPPIHWNAARELLAMLGAVDHAGRITPRGSRMVELGTHPRIAGMVMKAVEHGGESLRRATAIAALLEERDILRGEGAPPPAGVDLRVDVVLRDGGFTGTASVDGGTLSRVREAMREWQRRVGARGSGGIAGRDHLDAGELLLAGWPDRVAMRRGGTGRFVMRNGRGVVVDPRDELAHEEWIVAVAVDDAGREGRVLQAAALAPEAARALLLEAAETEEMVEWDDSAGAVSVRRETRLGAIVVAADRLNEGDGRMIAEALVRGIRLRGIGGLSWPDTSRRLRERVAFLARWMEGWPDLSDEALEATLEEWLVPWIAGIRRIDRISGAVLEQALRAMIQPAMLADLDRLAPERIRVPSGSAIAVDYSDPASPALAVRLQEVFGMAGTPMIAGGRVPVVIHLLSPGYRPVQVTRDLASFWRSAYFDVRRDLRGRYPRHSWPEDPLSAEAIRGPVKRRR